MAHNNEQAPYGYWVMAIFTALGFLSIFQKDYTTAAMNIALGVAIGGSQTKKWDDISLTPKVIVCLLLLLSLGLFGYVIYQDFTTP